MSEYIMRNGVFYEIHNDELTHHGVKGMKWGVRKDKRGFSKVYNTRTGENITFRERNAIVKGIKRNPKARDEYKVLQKEYMRETDRTSWKMAFSPQSILLGPILSMPLNNKILSSATDLHKAQGAVENFIAEYGNRRMNDL